MARYVKGTAVTLRGTYRNALGQVIDPSVVRVKLLKPDGNLFTYQYGVGIDVVREATGIYSLEAIADQEGTWHYRFESEVKAVANEGTFVVPTSHFYLDLGTHLNVYASGQAA